MVAVVQVTRDLAGVLLGTGVEPEDLPVEARPVGEVPEQVADWILRTLLPELRYPVAFTECLVIKGELLLAITFTGCLLQNEV